MLDPYKLHSPPMVRKRPKRRESIRQPRRKTVGGCGGSDLSLVNNLVEKFDAKIGAKVRLLFYFSLNTPLSVNFKISLFQMKVLNGFEIYLSQNRFKNLFKTFFESQSPICIANRK